MNDALLDLEAPAEVAALLKSLGPDSKVTLSEALPSSAVRSSVRHESQHVHEVVLAVTRRVAPQAQRRRVDPLSADADSALGRSWRSLHIFTTPEAADGIVAGLVSSLREAKWFFVRYDKPEWHLRLRIKRADRHAFALVLTELEILLQARRISSFSVEPFHFEFDRYGGSLAASPCIEMFVAESILAAALDTMSIAERTQLAVKGCLVLLYSALGSELAVLEMLEALCEASRDGADYSYNEVNDILGESSLAILQDARIVSGLERWRASVQLCIGALRDLEAQDKLTRSMRSILPSLLHMSVNRLFELPSLSREHLVYRCSRSTLRRRGASRDKLHFLIPPELRTCG